MLGECCATLAFTGREKSEVDRSKTPILHTGGLLVQFKYLNPLITNTITRHAVHPSPLPICQERSVTDGPLSPWRS